MSEKALNTNELKIKKSRSHNRPEPENPNEKTTMVDLSRTCKVVKGGKRFSFRALIVVGDGNGKVGVASGKANQVQAAIQKATNHAKKDMITFPIVNNTIPHEIIGKFGTGKVWMKPAAPGTGVIAGGGVRAVLEAAGVKDVLTKSLGSSNPFNVVYATLTALEQLRSKEAIAKVRGKGAAAPAAVAAPAAPAPAPAVEK